MSKSHHVSECFLGIIVYDGSGCRVVKVNQTHWRDCGQAHAQLKANGFVELRKRPDDPLGTFLGVDGGDVSFPKDSTSPYLWRAFFDIDAAQRWIDSFTKR